MKFILKNAIKTALPNIAKNVAKVVDNVALGGAVQNVTEDTKENPKGSIDWVKLVKTIGYTTIPFVLLFLLLKGVITVEQLKELLKVF